MAIDSPLDAINAGFALVPEERASQGLILDMLVERNIALPSLRRFRLEDEDAIARPFMDRFGIRGGGPASMLSGGNQQKVVLAKWIIEGSRVLLLDEPSRGLDVGAKRDVHDVVRQLAAEGVGVIVSSSEAEEIGTLCHRALVLSRGVVRGELAARAKLDRRELSCGSAASRPKSDQILAQRSSVTLSRLAVDRHLGLAAAGERHRRRLAVVLAAAHGSGERARHRAVAARGPGQVLRRAA